MLALLQQHRTDKRPEGRKEKVRKGKIQDGKEINRGRKEGKRERKEWVFGALYQVCEPRFCKMHDHSYYLSQIKQRSMKVPALQAPDLHFTF